jgi:hypothetical protein
MYVKREDGFDATCAAHRGNALGGLNELTRDRSVASDAAGTVVFWTTDDDLQPGDTVLTVAEHDVLAGQLLEGSFAKKFIPEKIAHQAKLQAKFDVVVAEDDQLASELTPASLALLTKGSGREERKEGLIEEHAMLAQCCVEDEEELALIKADNAAGRSVRVERLKTSARPGTTMDNDEDRILGESEVSLR